MVSFMMCLRKAAVAEGYLVDDGGEAVQAVGRRPAVAAGAAELRGSACAVFLRERAAACPRRRSPL